MKVAPSSGLNTGHSTSSKMVTTRSSGSGSGTRSNTARTVVRVVIGLFALAIVVFVVTFVPIQNEIMRERLNVLRVQARDNALLRAHFSLLNAVATFTQTGAAARNAISQAVLSGSLGSANEFRTHESVTRSILSAFPEILAIYESDPWRQVFKFHRETTRAFNTMVRNYYNSTTQLRWELQRKDTAPFANETFVPAYKVNYDPYTQNWFKIANSSLGVALSGAAQPTVTDPPVLFWIAPVSQSVQTGTEDVTRVVVEAVFRTNWPDSGGLFSCARIKYLADGLDDSLKALASDQGISTVIVSVTSEVIASSENFTRINATTRTAITFTKLAAVRYPFSLVSVAMLEAGTDFAIAISNGQLVGRRIGTNNVTWVALYEIYDEDVPEIPVLKVVAERLRNVWIACIVAVLGLIFVALLVLLVSYLMRGERLTIGASRSLTIASSDLVMGKLLGSGGFGQVFLANYYGTPVAVKQLHARALQNSVLRAFVSEARVMHELRHPNTVLLMGVVLEDQSLAIVTEFVARGALYSALHSTNDARFHDTLRLKWMSEICAGLAYLHARGIVHGDIKSLNVLLSEAYECKLADFGLSNIKAKAGELMLPAKAPGSHGAIVSTVSPSVTTEAAKAAPKPADEGMEAAASLLWLAPELIESIGQPSPAADVFAMGIVFWEIWAGSHHRLYGDVPSSSIAFQVSRNALRPPATVLPSYLVELFRDCVAHLPSTRPTAASCHPRIEAHRDDEVEMPRSGELASGNRAVLALQLIDLGPTLLSAPEPAAMLEHISYVHGALAGIVTASGGIISSATIHQVVAFFAQTDALLVALSSLATLISTSSDAARVPLGVGMAFGVVKAKRSDKRADGSSASGLDGPAVLEAQRRARGARPFEAVGDAQLVAAGKAFRASAVVQAATTATPGDPSPATLADPADTAILLFTFIEEPLRAAGIVASQPPRVPVASSVADLEAQFLLQSPDALAIDETPLIRGRVFAIHPATIGSERVAFKRAVAGDTLSLRLGLDLIADMLKLRKLERHPHVMPILAAVISPSVTAIIEPLMEQSMMKVIRSGVSTSCSFDTKLQIMLDVAEGAAFLGRSGMPHGHLTLAHIFLAPSTRPNSSLAARVACWSIEPLRQEAQTVTAAADTSTLAPELLMGKPLTPAADVFSHAFISLLWYTDSISLIASSGQPRMKLLMDMLAGWRPQTDTVPLLQRHPEVERLIQQCWVVNPDQRPRWDAVIALLRGIVSP